MGAEYPRKTLVGKPAKEGAGALGAGAVAGGLLPPLSRRRAAEDPLAVKVRGEVAEDEAVGAVAGGAVVVAGTAGGAGAGGEVDLGSAGEGAGG